MSKRVLVYSDLHIRPDRLEDCKKVLDSIYDIYKKWECSFIVNGGDTFHTRGIVETECLDTLSDTYNYWASQGVPQAILIGNHDQQDRAGKVHPLRAFDMFKEWAVVDCPFEWDGVWYFPYMKKDKIRSFFETTPREDLQGKIAFVHWEINGAMMNDWREDTDGIPVEWLAPFKKVFSGHYHFRNCFENVTYIGSPIQHNFAEMGQSKGVMIVDLETGGWEFVEIEGTSKHHRLEITWNEKGRKVITGDKKAIKENDIVEYIIKGDSDRVAKVKMEDLEKIVKSKKIKVKRHPEEKFHSRLNIEGKEIYDTQSIMEKYVDFVDTDLDKEKLMSVGIEIYKGVF